MSFLTMYLVSALLCAIVLGLMAWYAVKVEQDTINLRDLFWGLVIIAAPIFNCAAAIAFGAFLIVTTSKNIIIFGKKK